VTPRQTVEKLLQLVTLLVHPHGGTPSVNRSQLKIQTAEQDEPLEVHQAVGADVCGGKTGRLMLTVFTGVYTSQAHGALEGSQETAPADDAGC